MKLAQTSVAEAVELNNATRDLLITTAQELRGVDRRRFMARTVRVLGPGGQRTAERELGWNRVTIRKALLELDGVIPTSDDFSSRGRRRSEHHLPYLLGDIRDIVDAQTQTDPTFRSRRLFTRLTAAEVRRQLIQTKGYRDDKLPTEETIRCKLHQLGYRLRRVAKCRPQKSCPRPRRSSRPCTT